MEAYRYVAGRAPQHFSTFTALQDGSICAAAPQDHRLPAFGKIIPDRLDELPGERAGHSPFTPFGLGVDDPYFRAFCREELTVQDYSFVKPCF
jgi:hypothetical protein